jgi:hypothetical protein
MMLERGQQCGGRTSQQRIAEITGTALLNADFYSRQTTAATGSTFRPMKSLG